MLRVRLGKGGEAFGSSAFGSIGVQCCCNQQCMCTCHTVTVWLYLQRNWPCSWAPKFALVYSHLCLYYVLQKCGKPQAVVCQTAGSLQGPGAEACCPDGNPGAGYMSTISAPPHLYVA
jgi:hypothetical protein